MLTVYVIERSFDPHEPNDIHGHFNNEDDAYKAKNHLVRKDEQNAKEVVERLHGKTSSGVPLEENSWKNYTDQFFIEQIIIYESYEEWLKTKEQSNEWKDEDEDPSGS